MRFVDRKLGLVFFLIACAVLSCSFATPSRAADDSPPLNVLLFTADDLRAESLGCFGGNVPDLTPNLDRFSTQSMRFMRAHVNVGICQPSRGVLATGRYSHNSGVLGFMHTTRDIPTIMQSLRDAGYRTGILGKVGHSTPKADYQWDFTHDQNELGNGRSPTIYYQYCQEFFAQCHEAKQPFYFMVNSHDPHRPYHVAGQTSKGSEEPSRVYTPEEVEVPGFVPDLPGVRGELATYQNSVRRCDDTFGRVMQALDESGYADNTVVMFLSDNGIAIPFAKCNAYLASTHTPWMVRWPGVVEPGTVNEHDFISGIDFFPTVLEATGLSTPPGLDGRSFLPLLKGEPAAGRERVFTQIDAKAGGDVVPMRCVQDEHYGYIYNAFSDGKHYYRNNNEGLTMKAMVAAAPSDPEIAARIELFRYRVPEEFYDLANDPDCLHNLVDSPAHQKALAQYRATMYAWMKQTGDPFAAVYEHRDDRAAVDAVIKTYVPQVKKAKKARNANKGK